MNTMRRTHKAGMTRIEQSVTPSQSNNRSPRPNRTGSRKKEWRNPAPNSGSRPTIKAALIPIIPPNHTPTAVDSHSPEEPNPDIGPAGVRSLGTSEDSRYVQDASVTKDMQREVLRLFHVMNIDEQTPDESLAFLMEECGELSKAIRNKDFKNIREEIADVVIVATGIANHLGIDVETAVLEKIQSREQRFLHDR